MRRLFVSLPLTSSAAPLKYICSSGRERHPDPQDVCACEFACTPKARCLTGSQGQGPYAAQLKKTEVDIKDVQKRINEKLGSLPWTLNYYG